MKLIFFSGLIWFFAAPVTAQAPPQAASGVPLRMLDGRIAHVELTAGVEGLGGATIEDAVMLLRRLTDFPICIEEVEYDSVKDGLTLGTALDTLVAMKKVHSLAPQDEARLGLYQMWSATKSPSTLIGLKKGVFTLVQHDISVRNLLDRVTELDSAYRWRNDGSDDAPLIVIEPRNRSALDWPVPRICGSPHDLSSKGLYGPGGVLTTIFQAHNISQLEINGKGTLPDVQLDICRDQLVARDVLNLTIKAARGRLSWTLSGVRGMRFLTF